MDGTAVSADDPATHWRQLRNTMLRRRTEQLVGTPTNGDEHPELRFTIAYLPPPASGITVTLDSACDLADVYDLCGQVASACLDDNHHITFTRTTPDTEAGR